MSNLRTDLALAMLQVLDDPKDYRVVIVTNIPNLQFCDGLGVTYLLDLSDGDGDVVYDKWLVSNNDGAYKKDLSNMEVFNFFDDFPEGTIKSVYVEQY